MTSQGTLFSALHALADEIQTEKTAAEKTAAPTPSDPGGYQGATTHPTKDVDNSVQDSSEGARSSENTSDVKADQGAPSVDSTPEATPKEGSGDQDSVQLNIGTQQSATGEDPSVEDAYKGGKDDPGTTHPAATDNDSLDGKKYASASFFEAKAISDRLANELLADTINFGPLSLTKQAGNDATLNPTMAGVGTSPQPKIVEAKEGTTQPVTHEVTAEANTESTASLIEKAAAAMKAQGSTSDEIQAGYELAAALGVEKQAAQQGVADCIEQTIRDASLDADLFGSYVSAWNQKQAMGLGGGEEEAGEDHSGAGDDVSGAGEGGAPPEGGSMPPEGGGEASLGDLLGGGADPGGLAGAEGGTGGAEGGMGGAEGGMGGDPSEEEALMELVAALDELGIPIEALPELINQGGEGGPPPDGGLPAEGMPAEGGPPPEGPPMGGDVPPMGGGAPPMGGGAPPMGGGAPPMGGGAPPMGEGMKLASAAKAFRRSGKYRFKEAADGTRSRQLRDSMKAHLLELMGK